MGQSRPLFVYFWSFQTNISIFTTNICEKCPSSIRCQDLNPQPLERESLPITTPAQPMASLWLLNFSKVMSGILVPDHHFNTGIRIYLGLIQSLRANRIIISASTTVWPDLRKFRHFGKILSHWAICWMVDLVFGKLLYLLWHFYATAGQIVTAAMAEDWKIIKASGHTDLR